MTQSDTQYIRVTKSRSVEIKGTYQTVSYQCLINIDAINSIEADLYHLDDRTIITTDEGTIHFINESFSKFCSRLRKAFKPRPDSPITKET